MDSTDHDATTGAVSSERPEPRITEKGYRLGMKPGNWKKSLPPTLLDREAVEMLLEGCRQGHAGLRTRAAIGLLYRTGISTGELLGLRNDDLDLTAGAEAIHVHTGRLANRVLAVDAPALELLMPWLDVRRELPGDHLFCNTTRNHALGKRWKEPNSNGTLARLGKSVGIERLHAGAFRHSLAAELLIEQWPLTYIQAQLGLVSLEAFNALFKHLGIDPPPDTEVMEVSRFRPPWAPGARTAP